MSVLEIDNLRVDYHIPGRGRFAAVDGVSLRCARGECVGLVGESGCGKTTLANAVVGLSAPTFGRIAVCGGAVWPGPGDARVRASRVQMVFQDPYAALNPRLTIGSTLLEVLQVHRKLSRGASGGEAVAGLLARVELDAHLAARYPHELSGGQRQRVCIARALAVEPALIVADEPVSALDVSVQVQILNLLQSLQRSLQTTILFIAHDLATVRYLCDRVLVMYRGRIVEEASADALFGSPSHPYTQSLLSAVPDVELGLRQRHGESARMILPGEMPAPTDVIAGCPFHPRCPRREERCEREDPPAVGIGEGHVSCCHFTRVA